MTASLERGEWSAERPGRTLPPGKNRYPFYRRLGGPQGRCGRAENLVPTGILSRTVQPVAQSLYWLSYPAHKLRVLLVRIWRKDSFVYCSIHPSLLFSLSFMLIHFRQISVKWCRWSRRATEVWALLRIAMFWGSTLPVSSWRTAISYEDRCESYMQGLEWSMESVWGLAPSSVRFTASSVRTHTYIHTFIHM